MTNARPPWSLPDLKAIIERHWGFRSFRPLQEQAMRAVVEGRDSLVVMPTGGGKSLCYQAPAVLLGGTTVVISPLISLMKDQVDGLRECGVAAAQIDSSLAPGVRAAHEEDVRRGAVRLLFLSPERLVLTDFYRLLQQIRVDAFAIDEAHCISHWGHDFRPEYRQLNRLKELFPQASVHSYTATATQKVRDDVCRQLGLRNPEVLVGDFDRPNLTYRVFSLDDEVRQVSEILGRHRGEAGIVYCLRRRDVDELAARLSQLGFAARPYHAGLTPEERHNTQNAFSAEKCDLIVATVAFGMGIDRSNIRFVIHVGMPKSIEHYQQETGRAGRDGLEAECVLLHSWKDVSTHEYFIAKAEADPKVEPSFIQSARRHLRDMVRYSQNSLCRHRALVEYFGQKYRTESCAACDVCLGDREAVPDATVVAQKILSCVARVKENFGMVHVTGVLHGDHRENIRKWEHDKLSTYGLLKDHAPEDIRDWIGQLIQQQALDQSDDEFRVVRLTAQSWEIMRGQRQVRLLRRVRRPDEEKPTRSKAEKVSWEGVDRTLFETLREKRRSLAEERQVPPYQIFSDATLRELARVRPSTRDKMYLVYGVGATKLEQFGDFFLALIEHHCRQKGAPMDQPHLAPERNAPKRTRTTRQANATRDRAFELFAGHASVEDVIHQTQRGRSTVMDYLCEFIAERRPASIADWLPAERYEPIAAAARETGMERLKPIFTALGEKVPYDEIRLVVMHLKALEQSSGPALSTQGK
jgi:ATP-dependent DNA helicase RecQ